MNTSLKYFNFSKQVSVTGARALILLMALYEKPRTFEEIRDLMTECGVADKKYSIDTIRIDINTLKYIGCKITKATKTNNYCYSLVFHPFKLTISTAEIGILKNIYNKISLKVPPYLLLQYHELFKKLALMTADENFKEQLLGISLLKGVNEDLLKEFLFENKKHTRVKILYTTPKNKDFEYDITIEKLGIRSGKLYVYCYNHTIRKRSFLNFMRIKKILCNISDESSVVGFDVIVKYKLYSYNNYQIEDNEKIIEETKDYCMIQGRYYNDFIAVQRIMSFGPDCIVLSPESIKNAVKEKYEQMRNLYD